MEKIARIKLIILYILERTDMNLSNEQITNFILKRNYADYLSLQQSLSDLYQMDLLCVEETGKGPLYHISAAGAETLSYFCQNIPPHIRSEIRDSLQNDKCFLTPSSRIEADYHITRHKDYQVDLAVYESDTPIIKLTLTVPSEEEASRLAHNWKKRNQEIYASCMTTLL